MGKPVLLPQLSQTKPRSASRFPSSLRLSLRPSVLCKRDLRCWRGSGCKAAPLSYPAVLSQHSPAWV